ncbi:ROK family glucokinase [Lacicoccus qingdaonensis]|uniref:Glucokinase n=1 Tax=Lacicoccus qingdaonensis TaxID=576118 RepID=A0A1G9EY25_9BACL|nr:ROK family glucokinase [Salinicoccus qingdaonensis]SDK80928.1 glucokinase [Salinicoccus qingdaonensis]
MILAVDIGGTTCKLGLFDSSLKLVEKWQIPTDTSDEGGNILKDIHLSFTDKLSVHKLSFDDCTGAGIGVPGPVDFEAGTVNGAINLNWYGLKDIKKEFEEMSGVWTIVDNDANLATLGEQAFGAGQNKDDVVMFTLGTGVGGGVIVNNLLVHGAGGAAGEVGHIKVAVEEDLKCNCGGTGCLESVASSSGLKNMAAKYHREFVPSALDDKISSGSLDAKTIFEHAENGDSLSLYLVDKMSEYLGIGIGNIAATLNPSHIILGGGLSQAGEFLRSRILGKFRKYAFPPAVESTDIVFASLGNDAGIYGAAKIVSQYEK